MSNLNCAYALLFILSYGCNRTEVEQVPEAAAQPEGATIMAGQTLWVDSSSSAWKHMVAVSATDPAQAALLAQVAKQPVVPWYTEPGADMEAWVDDLVARISGAGALPIFVLYAIPQRDCGAYAAGGAQSKEAYLRFIHGAANGIGGRRAVVILEPDALNEIGCLSAVQLKARFALIREAVGLLKKNAGTTVYLDAGNANWVEAGEVAKRLRSAGIAQADGFALNISNFVGSEETTRYGKAISAQTGGKHFIIDTSRNGRGPAPGDEWCNPAGRGLGEFPTTRTGVPLVDAYLWVKTPGESDGECRGGPAAGEFWPEYALELIRNGRR